MIGGNRNDRTASLKRLACTWEIQLVSGEARTADFQAAARWRSQSPAHDAAFNEATRLWRNFGPAARGLLVEEGPPVWSPPPSQMGRRAFLGGASVFATAVAVYAVI